jgi:hypothetical protein
MIQSGSADPRRFEVYSSPRFEYELGQLPTTVFDRWQHGVGCYFTVTAKAAAPTRPAL